MTWLLQRLGNPVTGRVLRLGCLVSLLVPVACGPEKRKYYDAENGSGGAAGVVDHGHTTGAGAGGASAGDLGFSISVGDEPVVLVQGTSVKIPLNVIRTTDQGPVTLSASQLPEGVTFEETVVPAGSNEGMLTLTAAASAVQARDVNISVHAAGNSGTTEAMIGLLVRGPSGSLDLTFGTNGFQELDIVFHHGVRATAGPERVIVTGKSESTVLVAGLSRHAVLDTSFGTNGVLSFEPVGLPSSGRPQPMAPRLDSAGRWLIRYVGYIASSLVRITADGALDLTFGDQGQLELPRRDGNKGGVVELSNGTYLVGSITSAALSSDQFLFRQLNGTGKADGTDDTNRALMEGLPPVNNQDTRAFVEYNDGSSRFCTFFGGLTSACQDLSDGLSARSVIRLEPARGNRVVAAWTWGIVQFVGTSMDANFATNGRLEVEVPSATSSTLRGLATAEMSSRGEIYVLGDAVLGTTQQLFVAKTDEQGSYVGDFGADGFAFVDFPLLDKEVGIDLWVEGDGIYVLFMSLDDGESTSVRGKLHAARLWR